MYKYRIKYIRKKNKISQEELAPKLDTTRATISHYETGRNEPDITTLVKYARFFNVSVDYLLGISDIEKPLSSSDVRLLHWGRRINKLPEKDKRIIDAILRINEDCHT